MHITAAAAAAAASRAGGSSDPDTDGTSSKKSAGCPPHETASPPPAAAIRQVNTPFHFFRRHAELRVEKIEVVAATGLRVNPALGLLRNCNMSLHLAWRLAHKGYAATPALHFYVSHECLQVLRRIWGARPRAALQLRVAWVRWRPESGAIGAAGAAADANPGRGKAWCARCYVRRDLRGHSSGDEAVVDYGEGEAGVAVPRRSHDDGKPFVYKRKPSTWRQRR